MKSTLNCKGPYPRRVASAAGHGRPAQPVLPSSLPSPGSLTLKLTQAYSRVTGRRRVALLVCAFSGLAKGRSGKESMSNPLESTFSRLMAIALLLALLATRSPRSARAQTPPPQEPPAKSEAASKAPAQAPAPTDSNNGSEVSTRDNPATFKVRVNLVLVRVVVRDKEGKVVTGLKKEDFQLTDNRKPQIISTFSVETPESHKLAVNTAAATAESGGEPSPPASQVAPL